MKACKQKLAQAVAIVRTRAARAARAVFFVAPVFLATTAFTVIDNADALAAGGASGGDEVRAIDNGDGTWDYVHIFKKVGSAALEIPADHKIVPGTFRFLAVGGGGAGSGNCGGGGGAGGVILMNGFSVAAGTVNLSVGSGGTCPTHDSRGGNGANTVVTLGGESYTAVGGGGGGKWGDGHGGSGGSGGGGSGTGMGGETEQAASGSAEGLGSAGGAGGGQNNQAVAGGGGGAGGAGADGTSAGGGAGGAGKECDISGESVVYAAGGGGGNASNYAGGAGGSNGVGGAGTGTLNRNGGDGRENTGSGGGGGSGGQSNSLGGSGGSGIVIVRYTVTNLPVVAFGATKSEADGQEVYAFRNPATENSIVLARAAKVRYLVVGGGGAGASPGTAGQREGGAGGGGAGGLLEGTDVIFKAGSYTVQVGAGGSAGSTSPQEGADGSPSSISTEGFSVTAAGGGGGGIKSRGHDGGSGGGGSRAEGGLGTSGLGFSGGEGANVQSGGGGGGAGGAGTATTGTKAPGQGGSGKKSSITGTETEYARGGSGGYRDKTAPAAAGVVNTGGGGEGAGNGRPGGAGGSGIVVLRVVQVMPPKPQTAYTFAYDGTEHLLYAEPGVVVRDENDRELGNQIAVTKSGVSTYVVSLAPGYAMWGDGTTGAVTVTVTVTKPQLQVSSVSLAGWQEGEAPARVEVVSTPDLTPADYTVWYTVKGVAGWTTTVPTLPGEYEARIEILPSDDFMLPEDDLPTASFTITPLMTVAGAQSETVVDGQPVYQFTDTARAGTFNLTRPALVRYLVVGGGGAGASPGTAGQREGGAGGGGAGGLLEGTDVIFKAGSYTVQVGAGGSAGSTSPQEGADGSPSSISTEGFSVTAAGGGGGGIKSRGHDGGSGGGGSRAEGGLGTSGLGFSGGEGANVQSGGGGGGAGGAGTATTGTKAPGQGGSGKKSSITGTETEYARGGSGGYRNKTAPAAAGVVNTGGGGEGAGNGRPGGAGGSGIVVLRVVGFLPLKPNTDAGAYDFTYDGTEHILYLGSSGCVITEDVNGTPVERDRIAVTAAGTHVYTVSLKAGYKWADGTADSPLTVTVNVAKPKLVVSSLSLTGWQAGEGPNAMQVSSKPVLLPGEYRVLYREKGSAAWSAHAPNTAEEAGDYEATIELLKFDNFTAPDAGSIPVVDFKVWAWAAPASGDISGLGYSARISVPAAEDEGGFRVVEVSLSDNRPMGFLHRYAQADGGDLRALSASGTLLPVTVSWQPDGMSVVRVMVPSETTETTVTLFWGELTTGEIPTNPAMGDVGSLPVVSVLKFDPSQVFTRPNAVFKNRWIVEPVLGFAEWEVGSSGPYMSAGEAAYGTAQAVFVDAAGNTVSGLPTQPGTYTYHAFVVAGGSGTIQWTGLDFRTAAMITGVTPDSDVTGAGSDPTASGRLLLANDFENGAMKVLGQSYYLTDAAASPTYWEHQTEGASTLPGMNYLMAAVSHRLMSATARDELCGSSRLWVLNDIRIGNTYTAALDYKEFRNYLPWSPFAEPFTSAAGLKGAQSESAHLVFRNVGTAALHSPCYTNGIGTIYFDVVNHDTSETEEEGMGLVLEIATNCLDAAGNPVDRLPTDANVLKEETDPETGAATVDLFGRADWRAFDMLPLLTTNGASFAALAKTKELPLAVNRDGVPGGSATKFYRVCVPVNHRGPVRFRLRRSSAVSGWTADAKFILVDNVVVSQPAMRADLSPAGFLDETKTGKQVLGWEGAMEPAFPSIHDDDIHARARAEYQVNPGSSADVSTFVTGAKLRYRWRYLKQEFQPAEPAWESVLLNPADGFRSVAALDLPTDRQGDIEFWYEVFLNAPFYDYYDYSGAGLGLGGLYTENIAVVTNRADVAMTNGGVDWFVRLREGKSECEQIRLALYHGQKETKVPVELKDEETGEVTNTVMQTVLVDDVSRIPMEVFSDRVWRGYLPTPTNLAGTVVRYRFELLNRQEPGATEFAVNTNLWWNGGEETRTPVSSRAEACAASDWTPLAVDAATGYLLFQLDDTLGTLSVVHADYQNFNSWSDAQSPLFVGTASVTSENQTGVAGTSAKKQEWIGDFSQYVEMPATNADWTVPSVSWTDTEHMGNRTPYKAFSSDTSDAWQVGQGMWVSKWFRDETAGVALQMEGQGRGYFQLTERDYLPRGIEEISFSARLAQFINFSDFSYYDAPAKLTMTNYAFTTRAAFDLNGWTKFRGNASLSLIAYYVPGRGCYEFRLEQVGASKDRQGNVTGPHKQGQNFSLYRWTYDSVGRLTGELLGSRLNSSDFKFDLPQYGSSKKSYIPMYLSVSNATDGAVCIMAGVGRFDTYTAAATIGDMNGKSFASICYKDTSSKRLKGGTYGVLSANCEGVFVKPYELADPIGFQGGTVNPDELNQYANASLPFPMTAAGAKSCEADIENGFWYVAPGRMRPRDSDAEWGLEAMVVPQTITLSTAPAGSSAWTPLKTFTVDGFGTPSSMSVSLLSPTTSSIRLETDGSAEDVRRDVVIDSFTVKQWAGADWDDYSAVGAYVKPEWFGYSTGSVGATNFVFTQGWTKNGGLLMSAKRATVDDTVSIRSPLMDGYAYWGGGTRGIGLGMFSFEYRDADPHAKLVVQIATNNVTELNFGNLDNLVWEDVPDGTFSFEGLSDAERRQGVRSVYIGLHGVKGLMRLMIPSNTVAAAQASTDRNYGAITITKVFCRDEPNLDLRSWWGWNLRTVGPKNGADDEGRMYLPDLSFGAESTGLSLALNDSVTDGVVDDPVLKDDYKQHQPFVQTPTFSDDTIGSVSFRARRYDLSDATAYVAVYGAKTGNVTDDVQWKCLTNMPVRAGTYQTYTYTTAPGDNYAAFRLSVTGVDGVESYMQRGSVPGDPSGPVRVLIDEILVSEALRARMAFRNVGAFHSFMNGLDVVPNVPSKEEQPLCNEGWGVQCEVYSAQLADEIDASRAPVVLLHWYEGSWPWGFENWRGRTGARQAPLTRVPGETNLVYRSTNASTAENVVPMSTTPGTVVQYMLEVRYWEKSSGLIASTNFLNASEWIRPSWYKPLDLNAGKEAFSAYSILDTVSPGWAWINEVNIYGVHNPSNWDNSERDAQFVEIAVPQAADISGWSIRLLGPKTADDRVYTNVVAKFGTTRLPGVQSIQHPKSNMVFRAIGSRLSHKSLGGRLDPELGEIDDYWTLDAVDNTIFKANDEIDWTSPIGLQLVRASGIVEHEFLCVGTNWYGNMSGAWGAQWNPTNLAAFLERKMPDARFVYMGEDKGGDGNSFSVVSGRGGETNDWSASVVMTPGEINVGQQIVGEPPTPNGETIIIYANIDNQTGHLVQTVGDAVETNATQMIFLKRGSTVGTNITYKTDRWWVLDAVTTNGVDISEKAVAKGGRVYELNVGAGVSNNVTVVASARVDDRLATDYGLDEKNPYTPAVLDWLMGGRTLNGGFAAPDDGEIRLAEFWGLSHDRGSPMTLTEMYWLDMDPTAGGLVLRGGIVDSAMPTNRTFEGYLGTFTNVTMSVRLFITNRTENAKLAAWTPYTLRGLAPGEHSADPARVGAWTSATFKIAGVLENGLTSKTNINNWVSLRWFTFDADSFYPLDDSERPGMAFIEIIDPLSTLSPGYTAGWHDWALEHPRETRWPVFYSFRLNEWITPFGVERLNKESRYE